VRRRRRDGPGDPRHVADHQGLQEREAAEGGRQHALHVVVVAPAPVLGRLQLQGHDAAGGGVAGHALPGAAAVGAGPRREDARAVGADAGLEAQQRRAVGRRARPAAAVGGCICVAPRQRDEEKKGHRKLRRRHKDCYSAQ
jgi:hypothetical protein